MLHLVRDGFAIGHLRRTDVGFDLEFTLQTVNQNVQVKFAHALHDGLTGFQISFHTEGRVFGGQTGQTLGHFFLVALGLGLNRDFDHRIGEGHGFQNHRILRVTQGVTGGGVFQTRQRDDVACKRFFDLFPVVGVHHHHTTDALFLTFGRVQDRVTLVHGARVDPGEGQRTNEGVVHDFERQT